MVVHGFRELLSQTFTLPALESIPLRNHVLQTAFKCKRGLEQSCICHLASGILPIRVCPCLLLLFPIQVLGRGQNVEGSESQRADVSWEEFVPNASVFSQGHSE